MILCIRVIAAPLICLIIGFSVPTDTDPICLLKAVSVVGILHLQGLFIFRKLPIALKIIWITLFVFFTWNQILMFSYFLHKQGQYRHAGELWI